MPYNRSFDRIGLEKGLLKFIMLKIISKITNININSINWSKLHICFFYLFLFSIPFQTRKVFLTEYSFFSGAFTEYATFFIYASDIFLMLALFFWLVFNYKKTFFFNTSSQFFRKGLQINRGFIRDKIVALAKFRKAWLFLFLFIIWLAINTVINSDYLKISAFQVVKFIELFLLLTYLYFNLRSKKALIRSIFIVSSVGFLQSLIAIYQFIFQHSLFNSQVMHRLTGEAILGSQVSGIAKIVVDGEKVVRSYGTFPHPNVLGGFLIFSIIVSIYLLLQHKHTFLSSCKLNYVQFYNTKFNKSQIYIAISLFWIVVISTQITALLFTFSRSAWMGFIISIIVLSFLLYLRRSNIVSRETMLDDVKNNTNKMDCDFQIVSRETISGETKNSESKNNYISNIVSCETLLNFKGELNCYLLAIFISFLFIGLFDHYFWTLQQGRLIFWLILGMLLIDVNFKIKDK